MTTKHRIMLGFGCMIAIIALIAVLGHRTLESSVAGYEEYRRYSRLNVQIGSVLAGFNSAGISMNMFLDGYNEAHIKTAQTLMDELDKHLDLTIHDIRNPQRLEIANAIRKKARGYREGLEKLMLVCKNLQEAYQTKVVPNRLIVEETANFIMRVARKNNSAGLLFFISQMESQIADLRFATGHYINTRAETHAKAFPVKIAEVQSSLTQMKEFARAPQIAEAHGKLASAFAGWADALTVMVEIGTEVNATLARNRAIRAELNKDFAELSTAFDREIRIHGPSIKDAMLDGQKLLLSGSAAGLILGALAAFVIILGLIKMLRETSHFARALAGGDFHAEVKSREKGEIGELLEAMREIPAVLQAMRKEFQSLEKRVEAGELEAGGDVGAYRGGFADLVTGTNSILGRFLHILENIPSPVLMLNKEREVTYLNAVGRNICGGDYKGKAQVLAREDAGAENDALHKAAESLKPCAGETIARPQGKEMDISYTAIPILDEEGKLASLLQLVTDLTEIKKTQRTMRSVADQATAIAGRVAAASEQLSSQVEEVSQGAVQQSDHMRSTAAAMTEMNATVLEVARNAGQAAEQSEMTRSKAGDGAELVNRVVQSINKVNTVAASLQENMRALGHKAENVGGVMSVIADIADQTNLLALNAAIEAARAGEAGRGFAVVADEVRKLAEKTRVSTQDVGNNLSAIRQSAQSSVKEVDEAARAVAEATELTNTSGKALAEIVDMASLGASVVASIATAAEEQSATSEEINRAIEDINMIVSNTAEGMTQASAAVQELSRMAQELNSIMAGLR